MTPLIVLGAAEQQPMWQSLFFSFSSGVVGAIATVTAVSVFKQREGRSGWQVAMVMGFGSALLALPVLRSLSLSWTDDGKPVINVSLHAVLELVQETKAEATGARKEAAAALIKLTETQTKLAALTTGIESTKGEVAKLSGTVDTSQKECIAKLTAFQSLIAPSNEFNAANLYGGKRLIFGSSGNFASWFPDKDGGISLDDLEEQFRKKDANSDGKLDAEEFFIKKPGEKSELKPPQGVATPPTNPAGNPTPQSAPAKPAAPATAPPRSR